MIVQKSRIPAAERRQFASPRREPGVKE